MGTHIYTDSETERRLVTYKSLAAKASAYKKSTSPTNKRKALTLKDINDYFNTTTESSSTAGIYVKYSVKSGKNAYINRLNVIERDLYINEGSSPTPSTKYKVRVIYENNGTNAYLDKGTFISSGEYYEKNFSSQSLIFESVSNISNDTPCSVNGSIITAGPITANTDLKVVISSGTPSEDTSITWEVRSGQGDNISTYTTVVTGPTEINPGDEINYTLPEGAEFKEVHGDNNKLTSGYFVDDNNIIHVYSEATSNLTEGVIIYIELELAPLDELKLIFITNSVLGNGQNIPLLSLFSTTLPDGYIISAVRDLSGAITKAGDSSINISASSTADIIMSKGSLSYQITLNVSAVLSKVTLNSSGYNFTGNYGMVHYTVEYINTPTGGTIVVDTSATNPQLPGYMHGNSPGSQWNTGFEVAGNTLKWTLSEGLDATTLLEFNSGIGITKLSGNNPGTISLTVSGTYGEGVSSATILNSPANIVYS